MNEESNLVTHAKYELDLLGNGPMIDDHVLEIVKIFSEQGHSGFSGAYTANLITRLLNFENLTQLTNNPDEWVLVFEDGWQNKRNPAAFSYDGGKTYVLNGDREQVIETADYKTFMAERDSEGIK